MTIFEEAAAVLGADVVEDLRVEARSWGPLTKEQLSIVAQIVARLLSATPSTSTSTSTADAA